jgi:hypothetical protein
MLQSPLRNANHTAIVDTGATGHYLNTAAGQHCTGVEHTNTGPSIRVASGENIEATKRTIVPLAKEVSTQAKVGHIFDSLKSGSLFPSANYVMTTASLFLPSTTSTSTKMDKSSLSENAMPSMVSGISPWHRKQCWHHNLTN